MTARKPQSIVPELEELEDPSIDAPTGPVTWSPTWATDVAREAKRLRQRGHQAYNAWNKAAALYRPAELRTAAELRAAADEVDPSEPSKPRRPRSYRPGASGRARQILADAREPMTTREFAEAMGIQVAHATVHLRRLAEVVGDQPSIAKRPTILWELDPDAPQDGRQTTGFLAVLAHLQILTEPASVPEIARATGIPKPTVLSALNRIGRVTGQRYGRGGGNPTHLWRLRTDTDTEQETNP